MSDRYDAFISYSRADFDEVRTFVGRLASAVPGFRYWMDLEGIESGDQFIEKIVVAIDRSERVLFMVSENSLKSDWTKDEVMYAHNTRKRIIPILLRNGKITGWFLFKFGNTDTIDTQDERQVQKLIKNLREWCTPPGQTKATDPNSASTPTPTTKPISTPTTTPATTPRSAATSKPKPKPKPTTPTVELSPFKENGKWGYIDRSGNVVVPSIYEEACDFSDGLARVRKIPWYWRILGDKEGYYGFIDKNGNNVVGFSYYKAEDFHEGRARVSKGFYNDNYGYIDKNGNVAVRLIYEEAAPRFKEGRAWVMKDGKYGFIDKNGNVVVPLIYEEMENLEYWYFYEGRAKVKRNNKWGFVDINGNVVIPLIYSYVNSFSDGGARARKDGKWGYIDNNGNWAGDR